MDTKSVLRLLFILAATTTGAVNAKTYDVNTDGSPYSIAEAIEAAGPGDTVSLGDGTYDEPIVTVRDGEEGRPITITGGNRAIVNGEFDDRVVTVRHSWITLQVCSWCIQTVES